MIDAVTTMLRNAAGQGLGRALVAAAALGMALPALAEYPERPVRIVVPWEPGGSADLFARLLSEHLARRTNQAFVIENRPGASGNIGSAQVARAPADGYTLLLGSMSTHVLQPAIGATAPFDPIDGFTPVARLGFITNTLAVRGDLPVATVPELIAYAKARPGGVSYASAGVGSFNHLSAALLEKRAGITLLHVPYKGGAKAALATASGETDLVFSSIGLTSPHLPSGRLRILAVAEAQRSALLPGTGTVAETLPDYRVSTWYGLFAPRGLPAEVGAALANWVVQLAADPDARTRLGQGGAEWDVISGDRFVAQLRGEAASWKAFATANGIAAQ